MKKETKKYTVDGKEMRFDMAAFNELFDEDKKKHRWNIGETEDLIGDAVGVSGDAVHSWRFGMNAPANIELVEAVAKYFGMTDYMMLLEEIEEKISPSEIQLGALKRMYDAVAEYLWEFRRTNGFSEYWEELGAGWMISPEVEGWIYKKVEQAHSEVMLALQKEYIFIKKLGIYEKLEEYVRTDLRRIYDGKLGFGYRALADAGRMATAGPGKKGMVKAVTAEEDYRAAMNKIYGLLEPFV